MLRPELILKKHKEKALIEKEHTAPTIEKMKEWGKKTHKEWVAAARKRIIAEEKKISEIPDHLEKEVEEVLSPEVFAKLVGMDQTTRDIIQGKISIDELGPDQRMIVQDQLKPLVKFITGIETEQIRQVQKMDEATRLAESFAGMRETNERALAMAGVMNAMERTPPQDASPTEFASAVRKEHKSFAGISAKKLAKGIVSNVLASMLFS